MPVWETILHNHHIRYTYLTLSSCTLYFCTLPSGLTFNMAIDDVRKRVHLRKLFYPELLTGSSCAGKILRFCRPSSGFAVDTNAEAEYCDDRSIDFARPEASAQLELFLTSFIETIRKMLAFESPTILQSYCEVSPHDPDDSSLSQ